MISPLVSLRNFFPPKRIAKLRNDILMFQQHHDESLYDALNRFKDLLRRVPHHGLDLWFQVQIFYDHVDYATQMAIDYATGGRLRKLREELNTAYPLQSDTAYPLQSDTAYPAFCPIQREFEKIKDVKVEDVSLTYDTPLEVFNKEMMIPDDDKRYDPSHVAFIEWLASKNFNYKTMDHYTMKALWIYWIRGDDEVELTDEESSDDDDEIAKVFRIDTIIFNYETPLCSAFNEFNYLLKVDLDLLTKDIMGFKTYEDYKDDWIYEWNKDDYEWYEALEDCELKNEALRNKAIMEGFIKDNDDESRFEQMKRWNIYANYDDAYEINHEREESSEVCVSPVEKLICLGTSKAQVTWKAFGGNTRDLGSILDETGQDCNFIQRRLEELLTKGGDGIRIPCDAVWNCKRRRQNIYQLTKDEIQAHLDKEEKIEQAAKEAKLRNTLKKIKKVGEIRKKRIDNYTWATSSRLKPETITDIHIDPNIKPVVVTIFRGNDQRNFDVFNPFRFGDYGVTELDELGLIIQKNKNKVVGDLMTSLGNRRRKTQELEPQTRILGLECNRSLPEGIPFVNNLVIEHPEYEMFFIDVFGDEAFQRMSDIHKVDVETLLTYPVMASNIGTPANQKFYLALRSLIENHLDKERLKSKRVILEAVGYKLD
ncbi:VIER F-box protein 2 [Tanacetum coccineum]